MTDYETREMNCQSDSEVNMQSSRKSSSYSLNIEETTLNSSKYRTIETAVSSTNIASTSSASASASASAAAALRYGKIKQESAQDNIQPTNGNKENLMRQLKAELDEEIKDRRMIEYKQNVINGTTNGFSSPPSRASNGAPVKMREKSVDEGLSTQSNQNNNSNRKIRSKSVTFLDEMNTDDDELIEAMEVEQKAVLRQQ